MESIYDLNLTARIFLSIVAVALIIGPTKADFNATHATNPLWTPHARFHVVWQVLYNNSISLVVLYLLWSDSSEYLMQLYLAAILNFIWGVNFLITLIAMPIYGGKLADVNGIKPFRFNIFGKVHLVDTNVFGGTILMTLNTIGLLQIVAV